MGEPLGGRRTRGNGACDHSRRHPTDVSDRAGLKESTGRPPTAPRLPQSSRIHVIINPASGRERPILRELNAVFRAAGAQWTVSVTTRAGDACRFARKAVVDGVDVLAVYGGDGTLMEAAGGLLGSQIPIAILPGGTTNALALALGIPHELVQAARLACGVDSQLRTVDVGQLQQGHFLVAVGFGIPGILAERADREEKNRFGLLSYAFRSLQASREAAVARYHITLDGQTIQSQGVACIIANSGRLGLPGLSLAPDIVMDDGMLDVFVFRAADINAILSLAASAIGVSEETAPLQHWRGRRVTVASDPPQAVQADGEVLDSGPVTANLLPQALSFLVPRRT
jgi:diacylglycerol kinase (ATP)